METITPFILPDYDTLDQETKTALESLTDEAEAIFSTETDEFQATIDNKKISAMQRVLPGAVYMWPGIGLSTVFPSTKDIAKRFIQRELSEDDLYTLGIALERKEVNALYFAMVVVREQMRGKGYGLQLMSEHIRLLDPEGKMDLFSWVYSQEGLVLLQRTEEEIGRKISYIIDPNM